MPRLAGALHGLAALGVQGRVIGLMPLCENMPSGKALKPGDVVTAANGLSIEVNLLFYLVLCVLDFGVMQDIDV